MEQVNVGPKDIVYRGRKAKLYSVYSPPPAWNPESGSEIPIPGLETVLTGAVLSSLVQLRNGFQWIFIQYDPTLAEVADMAARMQPEGVSNVEKLPGDCYLRGPKCAISPEELGKL